MIFSKSDLAYQSLKTQFFKHEVEREYSAVVHGVPNPPSGEIESSLQERADGTVYSIKQIGPGWKEFVITERTRDLTVVFPGASCRTSFDVREFFDKGGGEVDGALCWWGLRQVVEERCEQVGVVDLEREFHEDVLVAEVGLLQAVGS